MTLYVSSGIVTGSSSSISMGVLAVTYQVKLSSIEYIGVNSDIVTISMYSGAGLTSGTSVTPRPLRQSANASAATSRLNPTVSGTQTILRSTQNIPTGVQSYQAPADVIVNAGSAIHILLTSASIVTNRYIAMYFDELHLSRSS